MPAIIALSVVLCIMIMCTSSFSWFTSGSQTGGHFTWSNNGFDTALSYNSSNGGGISMVTYSSPDGKTYGDNPSNGFGDTLAAGKRSYFRTDISNSSSADQSVSLYLSNVESTGGNFYLGVNDPLKTYKNYNNQGTKTQRNVMRVYLQPKGVWTGSNKKYYVCYTVGSANTFLEMTFAINDQTGGETYYADIPSNTSNFYFADGEYTEGWGRTIDLELNDLSQTQSMVYWLTGDSNSSNNKLVGKSKVTGANVIEYYSSVGIIKGTNNFSIGLENGKYVGKNLTYTSDNVDVCSVDNTGKLTARKNGLAKITIEITGNYNDKLSVTCNVTVVESLTEFPVITNLKIPAKTGDKDSAVSVYWYIKNDSDGESLTYKADDLYITL